MAFNCKTCFLFLFGLAFYRLGYPFNETFSLLFEREDINGRELFLLFIYSLETEESPCFSSLSFACCFNLSYL